MVAQAFDRCHLTAVDRVHERDARQRRHAVQEHRARPAMAFAAGDLRPGQAEILTEHLRERAADAGVDLVGVAVDP